MFKGAVERKRYRYWWPSPTVEGRSRGIGLGKEDAWQSNRKAVLA